MSYSWVNDWTFRHLLKYAREIESLYLKCDFLYTIFTVILYWLCYFGMKENFFGTTIYSEWTERKSCKEVFTRDDVLTLSSLSCHIHWHLKFSLELTSKRNQKTQAAMQSDVCKPYSRSIQTFLSTSIEYIN